MTRTILDARNISKLYPGVQALHEINFLMQKGEIRALVGENGAGKSTFVKILGGIEKPDKGIIILDGEIVRISNPHTASDLGIAIVHQELSMFPNLPISTNLFFSEICNSRKTFVNDRKINEKTKKVLKDFELGDISPAQIVGNLEPGKQQLIEIARAVVSKAKIIILDEPTSSLSKNETAILFRAIRKLKEQGVSIIFVSHRLDEVFELCDSITIFRDGIHIQTVSSKDCSTGELIEFILGREQSEMYQIQKPPILCDLLLEIRNLKIEPKIKDVSFDLHRGEILGIAGLLGSGRTEIVRAIFGLDKPDSGRIIAGGKPVSIHSPKQAINLGFGFITEDRHKEGLILEKSVKENIIIGNLRAYASKIGWMNPKKETETAERQKENLNIVTPSINQRVKYLSGGNQQKVVLSKWLEINPRIFILDDPTRGIDVGAKAEFYRLIVELAENGAGIIFISSELQELVSMCQRVLVIRNGRVISNNTDEDVNAKKLLTNMTGD